MIIKITENPPSCTIVAQNENEQTFVNALAHIFTTQIGQVVAVAEHGTVRYIPSGEDIKEI